MIKIYGITKHHHTTSKGDFLVNYVQLTHINIISLTYLKMDYRKASHFKVVASSYCKPEIETFSYKVHNKMFVNDYLRDHHIIEEKVRKELNNVHSLNEINKKKIYQLQTKIDYFDDRMIACLEFSTAAGLYRDFLDLRMKLAQESLSDPIDNIGDLENFVLEQESNLIKLENFVNKSLIENNDSFLDKVNNSEELFYVNELILKNEERKTFLERKKKSLRKKSKQLNWFEILKTKKRQFSLKLQKFDFSIFDRFSEISNRIERKSRKVTKSLNVVSEMEGMFFKDHLENFNFYQMKMSVLRKLQKETLEINYLIKNIESLKEENLNLLTKLSLDGTARRISRLIELYQQDKNDLLIRNEIVKKRQNEFEKKQNEIDEKIEKHQQNTIEYENQIQKVNEFTNHIIEIENNGFEIQKILNSKLKEIQELSGTKELEVPESSKFENLSKVYSIVSQPNL
ncbi:hypothetical protein TRFO_16244 [Tritrichomonas foetus]|uniref:DUF4201 domain-containing protein n=1 Tax=Tritrichomonas foetus TaxID=1144522 RepID=A0A1J4KQI1_9EUKA|nr:hypothetical protein TRFO_16244 [Tritrichomonas foetus]|eukprot:OHT13499.1 hypothetical protein TRFO_16244 [Tritrichomonas foetus]